MANNFIHYDILKAMAFRILDELYIVVKEENRLMVCDWRAYAILETYRQYNEIIDDINIPDIDDCFSGVATPEMVKDCKQWEILTKLHNHHWYRSQDFRYSEEYERFLNIDKLILEHYILTI